MLAQGRQVVASMEDAPHAMWLGLAGSYFLLVPEVRVMLVMFGVDV